MSDPKALIQYLQVARVFQISHVEKLSSRLKNFLFIQSYQGSLESTGCSPSIEKSICEERACWECGEFPASFIFWAMIPVVVPSLTYPCIYTFCPEAAFPPIQRVYFLWMWTYPMNCFGPWNVEVTACYIWAWVSKGIVFPICSLAEHTAMRTILAQPDGWCGT